MLALFCYRRSHMPELALAIASTCELRDLVPWGGRSARRSMRWRGRP